MIKTRFAPSPTGRLHVGNIRIALINWLFAQKNGGHFLLRFDDTDIERSEKVFEDGIIQDLLWLALTFDDTAYQSRRFDRYAMVQQQLMAAGRLYPCYETGEELALKRKILLTQGKPPLYDRAALSLTTEQKQSFESEGRIPHWRFLLNHAPVTWQDMGRGAVHFEGQHLSDPVLFRANGVPVYSLASVVDDIDFGISHVIRGEDHVVNTASQIQLCQALGHDHPTYWHIPLLVDAKGGELSKRLGSLSIASLRDEGFEAVSITALLSRLGSSLPITPLETLDQVVAGFDETAYSRATPRFDSDELRHLNARILHKTPFDAVKDRLVSLIGPDVDEAFWLAVRPNLVFLADVSPWWTMARGDITPLVTEEDKDFLQTAAAALPPAPWDANTWGTWTKTLAEQTGRKGKSLFLPLRRALTGQESGPDMPALLPLMAPEVVRRRLLG
jgi:glutamyl-tRNA synthetase